MSLIKFSDSVPAVVSTASAVGKNEFDGPLGDKFDLHSDDDRFGAETWEQSEAESQHLALNLALSKLKSRPDKLDALFAGDLINQCTSSAFGLMGFDVPLFGLYGACSTIAEGLILSAVLTGSGYAKFAAAVTSSHYCSAERQFRTPLEYGAQRSPTAQRTVTGSAAFIVSSDTNAYGRDAVSAPMAYIRAVMPGKVVDGGITDQSNMGAAMAPAAFDTLISYFKATDSRPCDYDIIATGDLGAEGHPILCELLSANGYEAGDCPCFTDCGLEIYDRSTTDVHAGGSGCGCSATVLASHFLPMLSGMTRGRMLFMATGALMSPLTVMQGQSIPGIAHLVEFGTEV